MYRRKWIIYSILMCANMYWMSSFGIAYSKTISTSFANNFKLLVIPIVWCFGMMSLLRSFKKRRLYLAATFCSCISVLTVAIMSFLNRWIFVGNLSSMFELMNIVFYGILAVLPFALVFYKKDYLWSNWFNVEIKNIVTVIITGVVTISLYNIVL